jgi:hypothetical protein
MVRKFLRRGVSSTSSNFQAGEPPVVDCHRLLIQYILSYPPFLEAITSSATWMGEWHIWEIGEMNTGF